MVLTIFGPQGEASDQGNLSEGSRHEIWNTDGCAIKYAEFCSASYPPSKSFSFTNKKEKPITRTCLPFSDTQTPRIARTAYVALPERARADPASALGVKHRAYSNTGFAYRLSRKVATECQASDEAKQCVGRIWEMPGGCSYST